MKRAGGFKGIKGLLVKDFKFFPPVRLDFSANSPCLF